MADTRAATTSHWKWHLAIVFAVVAAGTSVAQNRFGENRNGEKRNREKRYGESVLRAPARQSLPVRVADSRAPVSVSGEKDDPFANFPRAEIWRGNQRVSPAATDDGKSWTPNNESYKSVATRMIEDAIRRAETGDMKGALRLARWAKSFPVVWKKGEHSPEWLMTELPLIEKRRHNGELEQNQLRNAELASKTPPHPTPVFSEPDPLTQRKSAEMEERLIVLEDALEKDQEIEPVHPVDSPDSTTESDSALSSIMAYLAIFAGGVLFTLIVGSALVLVVFRKNSSRSGPVFRVELVNNAQGETVLVPARNSNDARRSEDGESPATEFADPPPLEDIPLEISGPTYDEEIKRREQERIAREEAMLQFVYEKNVELREELNDYERAA